MTGNGFRFPEGFVDDVRSRTSIVDLIGRVVPLKCAGRQMKGCCPFHDERNPSFYVSEDRGTFKCFGCNAQGDAFKFRMRHNRENFVTAVKELAFAAGMDVPGEVLRAAKPLAPVVQRRPADDDTEHEAQIAKALKRWRESVPVTGTPVEAYHRARRISIACPEALRCHPALPYWYTREGADAPELLGRFPAQFGLIQLPDRRVIGAHQTYLQPDGAAKLVLLAPDDGERLPAKKMVGRAWGGAVRLCQPAEEMAFGEGIETCLSVMEARPDLSVWAALSLGNIAGAGIGQGARRAADDPKTLAAYAKRQPWPHLESEIPDMAKPGLVPPPGTKRLILLADADNADPPLAEALLRRATTRFIRMGLTVSIARPEDGHDFNSMLDAKAPAEAGAG